MAYALVAHTIADPPDGHGGTSPAIDTTGSDLIVIGLSGYNGFSGNELLSDSKSNTWSEIGTVGSSDAYSGMFYCSGPTVGSGHTFTLGSIGSGIAGTIAVAAFSGSLAGSPLDQVATHGSGLGASSLNLVSSLTAAVANSLYITTLCMADGASTYSIDSSFSITDQLPWTTGKYEGEGLAWKISSSAENPTWSVTAGPDALTMAMAIFKPAASAAAFASTLSMMGFG